MFGLKNFFGIDKAKHAPALETKTEYPKIFAPGTKIPFDPTLVVRLKNDHDQILLSFKSLLQYAQQENFDSIKSELDKFTRSLNSHMILEFTKLYIFMEYVFKDQEENSRIIGKFRREMIEIGKFTRGFHEKWMNTKFYSQIVPQFIDEAMDVGDVLVRRMNAEEQRLYEIYNMAPDLIGSSNQRVASQPLVMEQG
jgi:hypothetical protein